MKKESIAILDVISSRGEDVSDDTNLMRAYLKQEKAEKEAITLSPKTLNNTAVAQYKRGNLAQSYTTFSQAFRVMPKNPSIALNYLQSIVRARTSKTAMPLNTMAEIRKCRETLESAQLSAEQQSRYDNVKTILNGE